MKNWRILALFSRKHIALSSKFHNIQNNILLFVEPRKVCFNLPLCKTIYYEYEYIQYCRHYIRTATMTAINADENLQKLCPYSFKRHVQ